MTDDLRKIGRDGHPSHRLYRTQENVESRNLSLCIHTHTLIILLILMKLYYIFLA